MDHSGGKRMVAERVSIDVGVWDWRDPLWLRDFYPPDLPGDWRAGYYANEFSCAGLPAGTWTVADLESWGKELPGSFTLWLECDGAQLAEPGLAAALTALDGRLAGVWCTAQGDCSALRAAGIRVVATPWSVQSPLGEAAVGLYRPATAFDLREARATVEAFAAAPGPGRRQLLATVAPARLERLVELVQLLGM